VRCFCWPLGAWVLSRAGRHQHAPGRGIHPARSFNLATAFLVAKWAKPPVHRALMSSVTAQHARKLLLPQDLLSKTTRKKAVHVTFAVAASPTFSALALNMDRWRSSSVQRHLTHHQQPRQRLMDRCLHELWALHGRTAKNQVQSFAVLLERHCGRTCKATVPLLVASWMTV